ncbi:hypothetical protein AAV98_13595 [Bacillus sp. CHD6a]|nr:hypothetical protein AAV98_13595 [Bacillus sp. CHD6a]
MGELLRGTKSLGCFEGDGRSLGGATCVGRCRMAFILWQMDNILRDWTIKFKSGQYNPHSRNVPHPIPKKSSTFLKNGRKITLF